MCISLKNFHMQNLCVCLWICRYSFYVPKAKINRAESPTWPAPTTSRPPSLPAMACKSGDLLVPSDHGILLGSRGPAGFQHRLGFSGENSATFSHPGTSSLPFCRWIFFSYWSLFDVSSSVLRKIQSLWPCNRVWVVVLLIFM